VELAAKLLEEVTSYTKMAVTAGRANQAWDRERATVGGNMVRLVKLLSAFQEETRQKRRETSVILSRIIFETVVSVRYMMAKFSSTLVDSYVCYSLRHERKLRDKIQANIAERGGIVLPIEDRMLKSIGKTEAIAGVSLDQINLRDRSPWAGKNLYEKATDIDLDEAYLAAFSGMSHHVHGSWQDLYEYHIVDDEAGGFTPNLEWGQPRPQPIFAMGIIVGDANERYFRFVGGELATSEMCDELANLERRIRAADTAHEAFLTVKCIAASGR
jgi:hypothetical protein